jgi:hypothetical protein
MQFQVGSNVCVQTRSSEFERDGEKRRAEGFAFVWDANAFGDCLQPWGQQVGARHVYSCFHTWRLPTHYSIEKDVADSDDWVCNLMKWQKRRSQNLNQSVSQLVTRGGFLHV